MVTLINMDEDYVSKNCHAEHVPSVPSYQHAGELIVASSMC